jgi:arylsulfatase
LGADTGTPVDDHDYQEPFRFTGKLAKLTIKIDRLKLTPKTKSVLWKEPNGQQDERMATCGRMAAIGVAFLPSK